LPNGLKEEAMAIIKRIAVAFHLIPKTMKGKKFLKRIFFGKPRTFGKVRGKLMLLFRRLQMEWSNIFHPHLFLMINLTLNTKSFMLSPTFDKTEEVD